MMGVFQVVVIYVDGIEIVGKCSVYVFFGIFKNYVFVGFQFYGFCVYFKNLWVRFVVGEFVVIDDDFEVVF